MSKQEIKNYDYEVQKILSDETATVEDTIQKLNNITEKYSKIADDELHRYVAKQTLGLVLELGGALLPFGGAAKAGGKITMKALKSKLGRKISQRIGEGIASGLVGGGAFGVGSGIANDKNPITEGIKDATFGAVAGGMLTGTSANVQRALKANVIKNIKTNDKMTKDAMDKLRKLGKEYYKDYLQDIKIKDKYGNVINFPWQQAGKIKLHNYKMLPELPNQIRKAGNYTISNDKLRQDANFFERLYNYYKGKNYEYEIRKNSNGTGNDFYQIKELGSKPAYSSQNQVLGKEPNTPSITPNVGNFNLAKRLINKFNNKASITNPDDLERIFTAEEIGKMSAAEFSEFEPFINEQINSGYGIPRNIQAQEKVQAGDLIWVEDYTRSDGTHVSGYFRHK